MAGNMGNESVTVKNLRVLQVDEKNGIVVLNGCVPGPKNQVIKVSDALGKPWPEGPMSVKELQPAEVLETPAAEGASASAAA
jgi:large subunit ribosomal protein L3